MKKETGIEKQGENMKKEGELKTTTARRLQNQKFKIRSTIFHTFLIFDLL